MYKGELQSLLLLLIYNGRHAVSDSLFEGSKYLCDNLLYLRVCLTIHGMQRMHCKRNTHKSINTAISVIRAAIVNAALTISFPSYYTSQQRTSFHVTDLCSFSWPPSHDMQTEYHELILSPYSTSLKRPIQKSIHILRFGRSKAFDTINRQKVLLILDSILDPDKVQIMKALLSAAPSNSALIRNPNQHSQVTMVHLHEMHFSHF